MVAPSTSMQFSEFLEDFELGISEWFKDQVPLHPKEYLGFLREEKAKRWFDTDISSSGLGVSSAKAIGGDFTFDEIFKGPTKKYELESWGIAILIQKEMIDWDLYNVFQDLSSQLAKSHTDRKNLVAFDVLLNGFNGSADAKYLTFQGEALFTTTHTRLDGGTWTNRSTAGLSHLGLQEALITMRKQVNERGRFARITAKRLITSVDQEWIGKTLLQSSNLPGTDHNDKNTLTSSGLSLQATSPYLTTPEYWFLWGNTSQVKMKMRLGAKPDLEMDTDVRNRNRIWTSYCSFGLGIFNSLGTFGSSGGA